MSEFGVGFRKGAVMEIKATISRGYHLRIGLVGGVLLGLGLWFAWDWKIAWPAQRQRYLAYQAVVDPDGDGQRVDDFQTAWEAQAAEMGWDLAVPEEVTETQIRFQLYYAIACGVMAAPFLFLFATGRRRFIATDEQAIWDHRGRRATWAQVTGIDKSRWQTKGIAVAHYNADGRTGRLVLDDWKFDRNAIQRILAHVEAKVEGGGGGMNAKTSRKAGGNDRGGAEGAEEGGGEKARRHQDGKGGFYGENTEDAEVKAGE